jgi:uncharacterized protein (DUF1697 family)
VTVIRYAALLRAVNLGSHAKIVMTDLRALLEGLGYADVSTYLQSGNAVFSGPGTPAAELADAVEARIAAELALDVRVMIRTGAELADVIGRSPLPGEPENPSRFFVAFLSGAPDPAAARAIEQRSFGEDQIWVSGGEAFLWCPGGAGRTALTNSFVEKRLGVAATSRNWNTVSKLASLTAG